MGNTYDESVSVVRCWVCWERNSVVAYGSLCERQEEEYCPSQQPGKRVLRNTKYTEQEAMLCMMNCERCGALLDEEWILLQSMCQIGTEGKAREESTVHSNASDGCLSAGFEQRDAWIKIEGDLLFCSYSRNREFWASSKSREIRHVLLSWCMAGFVLFQISAVAYLVLIVLLPDVLLLLILLHRDKRNVNGAVQLLSVLVVFLGLSLYAIVVCNYGLVLWRSSGQVKGSKDEWFIDLKNRVKDLRGKRAEKNNNAVLPFIGYTWCHICQCIKPPRAHHCRRCGVCVYNLDHHCVYAGNKCIGEGNMTPFFRFLVALTVGSTVCVIISLLYGWLHRARLFRLSLKSWNFPISMTWRQSAIRPVWFLYKWFTQAVFADKVWAVVFLTSMAASIGVSLLLHRQLALSRRSTTWLEELIHSKKVQ